MLAQGGEELRLRASVGATRFVVQAGLPPRVLQLKMALSLAQMHTCIAHLPTGQYYYIMDNKPKQYVVDRDWNVLLVGMPFLSMRGARPAVGRGRRCHCRAVAIPHGRALGHPCGHCTRVAKHALGKPVHCPVFSMTCFPRL